MSSAATSRSLRRQKCFLCDLPKSSWTILSDFSQPVCRGCVNYEGIDRVEDAIIESKRLRELEGGCMSNSVAGVANVSSVSGITTTTLPASLDTTAIAQVDSSERSSHVNAARFEPATPQSSGTVDFLATADLQGMTSAGLPANTIVGTSTANVTSNPAAPTPARADSSAAVAGGFDDFPSPLTPYSPMPDWSGRGTASYGAGMRVMDATGGYGPYNPLAAPEYMRPNPYAGYIAAHDSAFTYYGGWRAMKRSAPDDMFNPYAAPARPNSLTAQRRASEPGTPSKRLDKGAPPKSPATTSTSSSTIMTNTSTLRRSQDQASEQIVTIATSPAAKNKEKTGNGNEKDTVTLVTISESKKDSTSTTTTATSTNRDKKAASKTGSTSSPDSNGPTGAEKTETTTTNNNSTDISSSSSKTDVEAGKASVPAASGNANETPTDAQSLSSTSSSSANNANKQANNPPATPAASSGDAASQKSCNHCGCGLASVQYVQCPSVERHRYCLFCTFMHIEWSDPGAVSCPSKQRCLHPTSNVPWVFLPNEIESIRKAVQLSETPAIMQ